MLAEGFYTSPTKKKWYMLKKMLYELMINEIYNFWNIVMSPITAESQNYNIITYVSV